MRASAGAGVLGEGVLDMELRMASDRFDNRSQARMAMRVNDVPMFHAATGQTDIGSVDAKRRKWQIETMSCWMGCCIAGSKMVRNV